MMSMVRSNLNVKNMVECVELQRVNGHFRAFSLHSRASGFRLIPPSFLRRAHISDAEDEGRISPLPQLPFSKKCLMFPV